MNHFPGKLFALITFIGSVSLLTPAFADELPVAAPAKFAIQLPQVDRDVLVELVGALRTQLILRKQELLQRVADSQLDGGDALITAIMPGGLLYAGYKKARYENAKSELDRISEDIDEYSDDILALQSAPVPLAMALSP
ncbi:MAG: hypothetical protein PVH38_08795 [Gammaproteobacteria bacterium]|jgi:hypothetical protein